MYLKISPLYSPRQISTIPPRHECHPDPAARGENLPKSSVSGMGYVATQGGTDDSYLYHHGTNRTGLPVWSEGFVLCGRPAGTLLRGGHHRCQEITGENSPKRRQSGFFLKNKPRALDICEQQRQRHSAQPSSPSAWPRALPEEHNRGYDYSCPLLSSAFHVNKQRVSMPVSFYDEFMNHPFSRRIFIVPP